MVYKRRFVDAFDGSDLSSYDSQRKSFRKVHFSDNVKYKSLKAVEVKPEPDRKPDDSNANQRLVDAADPANEEEILKALGAMEVKDDTICDYGSKSSSGI